MTWKELCKNTGQWSVTSEVTSEAMTSEAMTSEAVKGHVTSRHVASACATVAAIIQTIFLLDRFILRLAIRLVYFEFLFSKRVQLALID